jgi:hypothetical protein
VDPESVKLTRFTHGMGAVTRVRRSAVGDDGDDGDDGNGNPIGSMYGIYAIIC